jgi:hypothetical protein
LRQYRSQANLILLFTLIISSCTNFAVSKRDNPDCNTFISGKMIYPINFNLKNDLMFLRKGEHWRILKGEIVEKTEKGYIFYPYDSYAAGKKRGYPNFEVSKREYTFEEIHGLVNKNKELLYGDLPAVGMNFFNADLYLIYLNKPWKSPLKMNLEPNQYFEYCLSPGRYQISKIDFLLNNSHMFIDSSVTLPYIEFEVKEGKNNYIGDFLFDTDIVENRIEIPCRGQIRPEQVKNQILVSIAFGLIGQLVYLSLKDNPEIKHTLTIQDDFIPSEGKVKSLLILTE